MGRLTEEAEAARLIDAIIQDPDTPSNNVALAASTTGSKTPSTICAGASNEENKHAPAAS